MPAVHAQYVYDLNISTVGQNDPQLVQAEAVHIVDDGSTNREARVFYAGDPTAIPDFAIVGTPVG